jgi:hypothetical protein
MFAIQNAKTGRPVVLSCAFAFGALLAATTFAPAADFPKSGEATFDRYQIARIISAVQSPVGKGVLWEDIGVTRNIKGEKPWDRLVDRCQGTATVVGEDWSRESGNCVKKDQDGDQIFVTWQGSDWTIVSGTGKYKGITGTGTTKFDFEQDRLEDRPDGWVSVIHHTVKWQINGAS